MADVPAMVLNNGVEMPQIGFGVFRIPEATRVGGAFRNRGRLPRHRYRLLVRQRDGSGHGGRSLRPAARAAVYHHQVVERRPGIRVDVPCLRGEPGTGSDSTTWTSI